MALTLVSVLGVQEAAGPRGVGALQPVLIEGVDGGVDLWETDRQAAVGFLHLLGQGFINAASRLALRLAPAAQAPWVDTQRKGYCQQLHARG